MKIYAGSDHAGFSLRQTLVTHLRARGYAVEDLGPETAASCDYPLYAAAVARAVRDDAGALGLLVCGSGLGVSIAANKVHGIRAVDAWSVEAARLSRAHNDANVLCLGERLMTESDALSILDTWLVTPFDGAQHARRVAQIAAIESQETEPTATPKPRVRAAVVELAGRQQVSLPEDARASRHK